MNELVSKFERYASSMNSKTEQTHVLNAVKGALSSWGVQFQIASKTKSSMLGARLCATAHALSE